LKIKWKELGIDPSGTEIFIPAIKDFQDAAENVALNDLTIPSKKGFLIIIRNK
jgi:hypothetical protein